MKDKLLLLGMTVYFCTEEVSADGIKTTHIKLNPNGVSDTGCYALNAALFGNVHGRQLCR